MRSTHWDQGPVSVLDRSMSVLTAFEPTDAFLSLAELCRRTRLPKSTAHRVVNELVGWGMLERVPGGVQLGMRVFELGQMAPLQRGIREAAVPFLADLFEATGETVHLAVLDGSEVVYIHKLDGKHGPTVPSRIGGRMPAYCTAVGKALLAFSSPEVTDSVLNSALPRRTARTVVAPGLLKRDLDTIAETGIGLEHEESTPGISCVSAPVLDVNGHAVAAISITGWVTRLNTGRLAPAVRTAALGIGRALRGGASVRTASR